MINICVTKKLAIIKCLVNIFYEISMHTYFLYKRVNTVFLSEPSNVSIQISLTHVHKQLIPYIVLIFEILSQTNLIQHLIVL